jgi:hypothetical protein
MKIYTSEISQFGRTLLLLNEEITFDRIGCAEIEDDLAKKIIKYAPDWYSRDKKELKKEAKAVDEDSLLKDATIEDLQVQVAKLRKMDESRVSTIKANELENTQIREEMGKIVKERDDLKTDLGNKTEVWGKEKEQYDYKFELALLDIPELQEMCEKLSLDTKDCIKKSKKGEEPTIDKKSLIELITNSGE